MVHGNMSGPASAIYHLNFSAMVSWKAFTCGIVKISRNIERRSEHWLIMLLLNSNISNSYIVL